MTNEVDPVGTTAGLHEVIFSASTINNAENEHDCDENPVREWCDDLGTK